MPKPSDPAKHAYQFSDDMKFLLKCIVFHPNKANRFLAVRHSADHHSRPHHWDFPGGNVLFGETHVDALEREVLEETDLKIVDIRPVNVVTNYDSEKEFYFLYIGFAARALSENVKLSQEHTEFKWVTVEEFNQISEKEEEFLRESLRAL